MFGYGSFGVKSITIAVSIVYCTTIKAKHSKIVNHTYTLKMHSVAPAIIIFYWYSKNCDSILFGKKLIPSQAKSRISNKKISLSVKTGLSSSLNF